MSLLEERGVVVEECLASIRLGSGERLRGGRVVLGVVCDDEVRCFCYIRGKT